MISSGVIIESLKIDHVEKKWAARFLFLLIFAAGVCSRIWPLGNPDFSAVTAWIEKVSAATEFTPDLMAFPEQIFGNFLYFIFLGAVIFAGVLVSCLYTHMYVVEKTGKGTIVTTLTFFKRLPVLLLFYLLIFLCAGIVFGAFSVILTILLLPVMLLSSNLASIILSLVWFTSVLVIVSILFFAPLLVTADKKNPIAAIQTSFLDTKKIKSMIFGSCLLLYGMNWLVDWICSLFLSSNNSAGIFLQGFFAAYFFLVFGRLVGVYYDRAVIHPIQENPDAEL